MVSAYLYGSGNYDNKELALLNIEYAAMVARSLRTGKERASSKLPKLPKDMLDTLILQKDLKNTEDPHLRHYLFR